ncbi:MAG: intradiol ring-cleavage dioxygenase, partial [Chloroflexota bacterium]
MTSYQHNHDDHDDDIPVGRVLSRRDMLKLLGGGSMALLAGMSLPAIVKAQSGTATPMPSCVVKPELTEGPYFVANELNRFDLRSDPTTQMMRDGIPLYLVYNVTDVTGGQCEPLADAQVDVWQCDADGVYSGVVDNSFDTTEEFWLRGFQMSDETGKADFLTIIPGWYSGRAVHIHFKIRLASDTEEAYEFTSQFFFDPEFIETIYAEEPYANKGLPDTPNSTDFIYRDSEGQLTLELLAMDDEELSDLSDRWQQARLDELEDGEELLDDDPIT